MKYFKFLLNKLKQIIKKTFGVLLPWIICIMLVVLSLAADGYTWEDFGLDGFSLNPNDYCNLTDVKYTAVLHDDPNGKANVEITEYLTFDVHAGSKSNTYKELWRELPEEYVDGVKVTYDVKSVTQILDNGQEIPYRETAKMYWDDSDYTANSTKHWHHSDGSGRYPDNDESVLIYIPWTYRKKMTFKIVYSLNNAALKYNDCSELYLSMYSGNSIKKLKSYKADILIPDELMPTTYEAYTFGTAKTRVPYTESGSKNPGYYTFSIDLDESDLKFNYHNRYIEFCLLAHGADKHIFTKYAPNNLYSHDNVLGECIAENEYYENMNKMFNTIKTIALISSIIIAYLIISKSKEKYTKFKNKYNLYEPEVDYDYFRDIPSDLDPIFASELVFMQDPFNENREKKEEYAAVLLSLIRKQYVKITKSVDSNEEWNPHNTIIWLEPLKTNYETSYNFDDPDYSAEPLYTTINTNTGDILEPLTTSERLYLELLERHARSNNSIFLDQFQRKINYDYGFTNSFVEDMEKKPALECGVMQGYFQSADYDTPKKELSKSIKSSGTLAFIWLILVNIISYFTPMALSFGAYTILGLAYLYKYFYLSTKASNAILFTQFGVNEQAKWIGLYNFLNSNTLINEKEVKDLVLWEKYLIYATAFGISEKVVNAIKINAVNLNIDTSLVLNRNSYIHTRHYHRTSRSFGHSIHTSSRGGGSFGGHGYGGGGRGGGGGGGGH